MNDTLDSRALRRTDCYGQRFMRPGRYAYNVLPAGGHILTDVAPYSVVVQDRAGNEEMQQHTVQIGHDGHTFRPDQPEITIAEGDLVLWHCPVSTPTGYEVVGQKTFFASASLTNECGYSHAFGIAGDYEWVDANGGGAGGVVHVLDPGCRTTDDLRAWRESLSTAHLVTIVDGQVDPAELTVRVGQTVYFTVVTGTGVTVTDRRLVEAAASCAAS